jgi:FtsH-binding integral membrane protein
VVYPRVGSPPTARTFERRLFIVTAIVAALIVVGGFARSYYLRSYFETQPLAPFLHLHGAAMTVWFALFVMQVLLISVRRPDLHRRVGMFAAVAAVLLVAVGILTALRFVARTVEDPQEGPVAQIIAAYDLVVLAIFMILIAIALVMRRQPAVHKRLMVMASLSLLGPPLARIVADETALLLNELLVAGVVIVDTIKHRRLDPAFGWGGLLAIGGTRAAACIAFSPHWSPLVVHWAQTASILWR